ncbi:hypothetical protein HU200_036851 [Digitaria exilis]|uniref:Pentatricopeptide repeat-containing protein n=1 Tax=Digitaria exilis TaxID=1010633 RepID=A0A835BF42_9POAL|nr:hypothetical protein HU200_036851 [Digitaria exilis]
MESIISRLAAASSSDSRPREQLLCRVISAYGHARLPAAARRAFAHPAFPVPRTARALNALLHALLSYRAQLGDLLVVCGEARIAPDACTYNILMRAAAALGSIEHARYLFDEMLQRGIAPTVSRLAPSSPLCAMLASWKKRSSCICYACTVVRAFFWVGQKGCPPDVVTYIMLFDGMCAAGKFLEADQGIEREGDVVLLESVLYRLAKVNALESSGWEKGYPHDAIILKSNELKMSDNCRVEESWQDDKEDDLRPPPQVMFTALQRL